MWFYLRTHNITAPHQLMHRMVEDRHLIRRYRIFLCACSWVISTHSYI